jgi:uncharacterized OsmC-like protein
MARVTYRATSKRLQGLAVENIVRNYKVTIDQPKSAGGTDTGMTPTEAMLAALGSCQVIVATAFAAQHNIDLEDVWVEVEGDIDTDGYMKGTPGVRTGFEEVRFTMHVKSNASQAQLDQFRKFVETRCPITDTMTGGTRVVAEKVVNEKEAFAV